MVRVENPNAQVHSVFPTPVYVANLGHDLIPEMLNYLNGQEFNEAGIFGIISSYAITPLLTKVILTNFDFDNSEDLTLEEMLQDRESLFDLDFSKNDQIEIDNQKINNQIKDFINKLQGLGSLL